MNGLLPKAIIHFIIFTLIWLLLSSTADSQRIDFSARSIQDSINFKFWKHRSQKGIKINPSGDVVFLYPISFHKTVFNSPVEFDYAIFQAEAVFIKGHFNSWANFSSAKFRSRVDFSDANFDSLADFSDATFDSIVRFTSTTFQSNAGFISTNFDAPAQFQRVIFDSGAFFTSSEFNAPSNFSLVNFNYLTTYSWAQFHSGCYFFYSKFNFPTDFRYTIFDSMADFNGVEFNTKADFRRSKFRGKASFLNAVLPETLDFRYVTDVSEEIDFTIAKRPSSGSKCKIALDGTNISNLKLNMNLFELYFPDTTIDTTWPTVDTIVISEDRKSGVYEAALKKLKDEGFMESCEILDIEYRQFKYEQRRFIGWIQNLFDHYWWNYRYNKEWILCWSGFLWLLFSFINIWAYRRLHENVYRIEFLNKFDFRKWGARIFQAITYTAIVFFGLKMDLDKFKKGAVRNNPGWFAYLMIIYVMGIFCLGFIANYIFS